ncbi:DUF742 domain-containing protein [Actinomycetospora lutea]|uniref:DUF742 domain-containing protein n=1 Tax=Actinomycetospora lutea TaxID=663604 RepID=UPI002365CBCC|nr:DUF742 domain-containing protein [Actinomycetospora lutea]MDD7937303.1 DUF742 domain-containing protein [Actinomycetospora lutea]
MSDGEGATGAAGGHRRRARVGRTGARFPRALADEEQTDPGAEIDPTAVAPAAEGPDEDASGPLPLTGARFGSRGRRTRREAARAKAEDAAVPLQASPVAAPARPGPEADDPPTLPLYLTADPPPESTRTRVRPYVRTRGRTRTRADLAVETLVSIPSPRPPLEDPEHVALGDVVGDPRSVAEVAALLSVPLGVARVIIDDMAGAGLLVVHPRAVAATGAPSRDIMQRVLDGLHRL